MFKRKLNALDFPNESININDESEFRKLIIWLEDEKIRHRAVENRGELRKTESPTWPNEFAQFLKEIHCPFSQEDDKAALVDWLLALAVRLEYGDNAEKYKNAAATTKKSAAPQVVQANPLDNLNFETDEFKAGVASLARLLNIQLHPDHLITLKAISSFIKQRLSPEALAAAKEKEKSADVKPYPLKESNLGFDTGDYVLNEAAKILRLLYIHDLRNLQTRINEAIVATQAITANPKTDTRLGKVGK